MKALKQIKVAKEAGVTRGFVSRVLNPDDPLKPSWKTAKRLGLASGTNPIWWVEKNLSKLHPMFNSEKIKADLNNKSNTSPVQARETS